MIIEFLIWLLWAYILMGYAEWKIHIGIMHKRWKKIKILSDIWRNHAVIHHKLEDNNSNIDLPIYYHLILGAPLLILLFFLSVPGFITLLAVFCYHSWMWTVCHRAIHGVKHHRIEATPLYKIIKEHHEGHHKKPNKNYNVVMVMPSFLCFDKIFGTKI